MRLLSIGNSFSQDAHAYLHDAACSLGLDIECLNLYIGGCSLERHYNNLLSGEKAYSPEYNGIPREGLVSLGEILEGNRFDVVTLQQASHFSGKYETYHPYIDELYKKVIETQPYAKAASELGVDIIPVGSAVQYIRENVSEFDYSNGGISLNRDGFHLSIPLGRFLAALVWIEKLTGKDVTDVSYFPPECTDNDKKLIKVIAANVHKYMTAAGR